MHKICFNFSHFVPTIFYYATFTFLHRTTRFRIWWHQMQCNGILIYGDKIIFVINFSLVSQSSKNSRVVKPLGRPQTTKIAFYHFRAQSKSKIHFYFQLRKTAVETMRPECQCWREKWQRKSHCDLFRQMFVSFMLSCLLARLSLWEDIKKQH